MRISLHRRSSQHVIDCILFVISERFLTGGLARKKPTLLIQIFSFQSPYMSFRLLDASVNSVKACKDAGAHVITFIIDSQHNR